MKNKKKLIKRIGAFLCAVVVAVSSMGVSVSCFASSYVDCENYMVLNSTRFCASPLYDVNYDYSHKETYPYYVIKHDGYKMLLLSSPKPITLRIYYDDEGGYYSCYYVLSEASRIFTWNKSSTSWGMYSQYSGTSVSSTISSLYIDSGKLSMTYKFVESNHDILIENTDNIVFRSSGSPIFNENLGYLQNVSRKSTYIRGALYNYDEDSLTYHWYHDLQSSSGVDLTSGEYKVRHYISNATVKGYEKEDIVEMSDKYLMAEYDASQGYFSYLQKDYLDKLDELGYEEIGFVDKYLNGYFTLQHHYFQIVNTSTNEVGGYLHFYPKDVSGDSFGVEMEYEGLDDNFDIVENGPSGYIDTSTGSGETIEDALENADQPKLDDLGGIDPLIESIEGYSSQVGNVTSGVGTLLGALPPWVLGLLGLSVAMSFVVIVVKALRG